MSSVPECIERGVAGVFKLAFAIGTGVVIGAVIIMSSGCNAVSGLGRDLSQTSDMLHRGIKSYYSQPRDRDGAGGRMVKDRDGIERIQ